MFPDAREFRLGPDERGELEARLRALGCEEPARKISLLTGRSLSPAPGGLSKNSMPRASSARLTASAVRDIKLSPRSNLLIVEVDTHAFSASSRTPIRKAARAILH